MFGFKQLKNVNWYRIILFYVLILWGTFLIRKLPNLLQETLGKLVGINLPWNMNHGIIIFIISIIFYRFSGVRKEVSFLGNSKKTIIFPILLLIGYSVFGIENDLGINKHLWAAVFIIGTFIYDIMEEYTWRGYLNDSLEETPWIVKSVITGIFWAVWHTLIFKDFNQFGSFTIFMLLCIVFSFILTYSTIQTKSIIVPSTIHALMVRNNIVTLILLAIYIVLLIIWNKKITRKNEYNYN